MKVKPLHDRVLIKRIEEKETIREVSSSRIRPKRSPRKAKSSLRAVERDSKTERSSRWKSKPETACCSVSTRGRKSSWMIRNT